MYAPQTGTRNTRSLTTPKSLRALLIIISFDGDLAAHNPTPQPHTNPPTHSPPPPPPPHTALATPSTGVLEVAPAYDPSRPPHPHPTDEVLLPLPIPQPPPPPLPLPLDQQHALYMLPAPICPQMSGGEAAAAEGISALSQAATGALLPALSARGGRWACFESAGAYPRVAHRHLYLWIDKKVQDLGEEEARVLKSVGALDTFYAEVAAANAGNTLYSPAKLQAFVAKAPPYALLLQVRTLRVLLCLIGGWFV